MEESRNCSPLMRLVSRYPILNEDQSIIALLSQGRDMRDEDIVNVCSNMLLRPDITVAVAGCFRHILPQIVRNVVDAMRKRYNCRMNESIQDISCEDPLATDSWNLYVHEYVVVAFSRILELAPHLLSSILQYFLFAPPPFERLFCSDSSKFKSKLHLLDVVRASYRFAQLETASFERLWDWSPFLDLLTYKEHPDYELSQDSIDVRWCAVQVISLILKLSDEATRGVSLNVSRVTEETTFTCLLRWEEFCQEIVVEKSGWFLEPSIPSGDEVLKSVQEDEELVKWRFEMRNQVSHVEICGVELPVKKKTINKGSLLPSFRKSFIISANLKESLKALALAISCQEPVLLEGPPGCGKTSIIEEFGRLTGNSDAVHIHLDEQVDCKTLLGTYVCTDVPGEFKWQPGAVTQAVLQGLWVVFEDVDRAPFEVLSALAPLLEGRKLYIPGFAEIVEAADGFQIFATISRSNSNNASHLRANNILSKLWRRIAVPAPNDEELSAIISSLFPSLKPLLPKLIGTLKMIDSVSSQLLSPIELSSAKQIVFGRQFSTRDLLKWCKRLKAFTDFGADNQIAMYEAICREAVDCLAGCVQNYKNRRFIIENIAKMWGVTEEQVNYFESLNKPILQVSPHEVKIGRACLAVNPHKKDQGSHRLFASTGHAMRNLERIAVCVQQKEPVLLVGETGTGKTTLVQHLAEQISMPLTVMNLSQQSDTADFIGGFKPVEAQHMCMCLLEKFQNLFLRTFPSQNNSEFVARVHQFAIKKKFKQLLTAFGSAVTKVESLLGLAGSMCAVSDTLLQPKSKRKRPLNKELIEEWHQFSAELEKCKRQVAAAESMFAFSFIEGAFVKALRYGHWILLDEINLAPIETLERLTGVLEGDHGSLSLTERGDIEIIPRHPDFRVFACMNPATDVGKHDLPLSLKTRFTEFYINELTTTEDLETFVFQYLGAFMPSPPVSAIVTFYQQAQQEAETRLFDSANQKPRYSLRSLARALEYSQVAMPLYGFARALYDGICMTFLTLLDPPSRTIMENLILVQLMRKIGVDPKTKSLLAKTPSQPSHNHVQFEHFWLEKGNIEVSESCLEFTHRYVVTQTRREHLQNLAKAVFIRKYPVLLQGPTSSGKTSLVEYLATVTCHRFVRINNHEHTDLQEYLGTYVTDSSGKLVFQEGILVEAVRNGYWIVLDELNLAPSEVLEALNRLLDDNRELFVPELQMVVKPHPHFMLFATQNPPGAYGGRKVLSRAFRNRFLELHVDDIPEFELCSILEKRCEVPKSYADKMVDVMRDLQRNRQASQAFAGKHGFMTPRDLFRWADRHRKDGISYEDLARVGYMLLAERLRESNERQIVLESLEKNLRVKIDISQLYAELSSKSLTPEVEQQLEGKQRFGKIVWTNSMKRLFSLVEHCYKHKEPMLLIGETGCGKTTVCQLLALLHEQNLHILNCHQHTETADFLGGFRPVRERDNIALKFEDTVNTLNISPNLFKCFQDKLSSSIDDAETTVASIEEAIRKLKIVVQKSNDTTDRRLSLLMSFQKELQILHSQWKALFVWQDGPLVEAMRKGDLFLVDEISLADDSVLERLNSVLEPKRVLVLAEKGGMNLEELVAHPNFLLMATMNPGGDFGKKELSPALRNRFTEIWVPAIEEEEDIKSIISARFIHSELQALAGPLFNFWQWFHQQNIGRSLTVRDLLSWINFINTVECNIGMYKALIHGAFLVVLDGLGLGLSNESIKRFKKKCFNFLLQQIPVDSHIIKDDFEDNTICANRLCLSSTSVGISPFFISKGCMPAKVVSYEIMAPTTSINTFRILRAMQLLKPVLIEGSPGVGKTSLIAALANISCHSLVRINLSEQTDMMDLLGSDFPIEGQHADFSWSDGVFLQALKTGKWVVLDELNLASQSVLEGLNACLDHRGEVFIPELGRVFKCHPDFRIFACQNPSAQGGGRKTLPRSFLNRFTKVYVDTLSEEDFLYISNALFPRVPKALLEKLIKFNSRIFQDTMISRSYGHVGAPWEFNLRDVLRSCTLIGDSKIGTSNFLELVYLQRMRSKEDRSSVLKLFEEVFGQPASIETFPKLQIDAKHVAIGTASLRRLSGPQAWKPKDDYILLSSQMKCLESMMLCVQNEWMCILVGPTACGKTSLVRLLAKITGNPLQEFSLSTGTDTTDLLGCFEQYDLSRSWKQLVSKVHRLVEVTCSLCLTSSFDKLAVESRPQYVRAIMADWATFEKSVKVHSKSSCESQSKFRDGWHSLEMDLLSKVLSQIRKLAHALDACLIPDVEKLETELMEIRSKTDIQDNTQHFEWVDGGFLKAVQNGDWVLLENANLCNPTVLDRLNPLLEPDGAILVNERGLVDNKPMMLRAHPNFRLFLTVDPCYGEISRAMRNRGVEIFVMQPYTWIKDEYLRGKENLSEETSEDVKRYLINAGLPSMALVNSMWKAHIDVKAAGSSISGHAISLRDLHQWVSLFWQIFEGGSGLLESLRCSWKQIYVHGQGDQKSQSESLHIFDIHFSGLSTASLMQSSPTLQIPGGWPHVVSITQFVKMSVETVARHDCMYLQHLIGEQVGSKINADIANMKISTEEQYIQVKLQKELAPVFPIPLLQLLLYPSSVKLKSEGTYTDFENLDQRIIFAALWMIERVSNGSAKRIRLVWLKSQISRVGLYCNSLVLFTKALQRELDHPMFSKINSFIHDSSGEKKTLLTDRILCTLLQWQVEDDIYLHSQQDEPVRMKHLITQSYRYHASHNFNRMKTFDWKNLKGALYPLFNLLRNFEEEFIYWCFNSGSPSVCEEYVNFLDSHKLFWRVIYEGKWGFETYRFVWSWKKLKQNGRNLILRISEPENRLSEVIHHVVEMFKIIDIISHKQYGEVKLYLWKNSGHPYVPSSKEALDQLQEIFKFCEGLQPGSGNGENMLTSEKFRRLALEGVSMALWLLYGMQTRGQANPAVHSQRTRDMSEINGLINTLQRRQIEDKGKNPRRLTIPKRCKDSQANFLEDTDYYEDVLFGCLKPQELASIQWLDSVCLRWDRTIIALVSDITRRLLDSNGADIRGDEFIRLKKNLLDFLNFAIKFSSRSPMDYVPHQQIVWLINANADGEIDNDLFLKHFRNVAHQLYYNWHPSAWNNYPPKALDYASLGMKFGPNHLYNASDSVKLTKLITNIMPLSEYTVKILELRAVSKVLWSRKGVQTGFNTDFLLANTVFCQIITSYTKTFEECDKAQLQLLIKTLHVETLQNDKARREIVRPLQALLKKSSDEKFLSLVDTHIDLCINLLYDKWHPKLLYTDAQSVLAKIWILLGYIRLKLMLPDRPYDPAAKHSYEFEILSQQIAESKLELEVRQQSDYLIRGGSKIRCYSELEAKIVEIEAQRTRAASKCVYRSRAGSIHIFYKEIERFVKSLDTAGNSFTWIAQLENGLGMSSIHQTMHEIYQWQEIAEQFICLLKAEYLDYQDLAQPIQLCVFDLKLGLSLLLSAFLQGKFLKCGSRDSNDVYLHEALCAIMEYPSRSEIFSDQSEMIVSIDAVYAYYFLGKGFIVSMDNSEMWSDEVEREVLLIKLKVKVFRSTIAYIKKKVMHARIACGESLKVLAEIFHAISLFWGDMVERRNAREDKEQVSIQFKQHSHSMDLESEHDEEGYKTMFPNYLKTFDPQHGSSEEVEKITVTDDKVCNAADKMWKEYEDVLSREITDMHNNVFSLTKGRKGEYDSIAISNEQHLQAFALAYAAGETILEGAGALLPASVNERIVSSQMLMLSLKHEALLTPIENLKSFNVYQDGCPVELACLLNPLAGLKERISELLTEWPDQPSLLQLMRGVEVLLSLPTTAPLMKALTGVEHLLAKAQLWEENAPKHLSLAGILSGLQCLVSRWRRFEIQYWASLLEKIEIECETQADKLWFPLYNVLHPALGFSQDCDFEPTIASLEEFLQTATLGEYKKRLKILVGFYGEFCILKSGGTLKISRILNNLIKYYSQFLSQIEQLIATERSIISKELQDFMRLHKWDERSYYSLVSSADSTHRRVFKLVKKYKALLSRSALTIILEKKQSEDSSDLMVVLGEQDNPSEQTGEEGNGGALKTLGFCLKLELFFHTKVQDILSLCQVVSQTDALDIQNGSFYERLPTLLPQFWSLLNSAVFSELPSTLRQRAALEFEELAKTVIVRSAELQKNEKKTMVKKKALVDLLKTMRNLGMRHHKSVVPKEQRTAKFWIEQPACRISDLLEFWMNSSVDQEVLQGTGGIVTDVLEETSRAWKRAEDYYFKNLALMQKLKVHALNHHKDLTLQEVRISTAYMEHARYIQLKQRCYSEQFALKLVRLQNAVCQLSDFDKLDGGSRLGQPGFLRSWLWVQKELLDSISNTCNETLIFYKKAKLSQNGPQDEGPYELASISHSVEHITSILSSCKNKVDAILVSGVELLCTDEAKLCWPVFITPSVENLIGDNFSDLKSAKVILENVHNQYNADLPGMDPLCHQIRRGVIMADKFEEQSEVHQSTDLEKRSESDGEYERQREKLLSEVLLSVQELTRLKGKTVPKLIETGCSSQDLDVISIASQCETIQSWLSLLEDQMSALRLEKLYASVVSTVGIGVQHISSKDASTISLLKKDFLIIAGLVKFIAAAGLTIFIDYINHHKSLSKFSYVLSKIFCTLYKDGYCKRHDEVEDSASEERDTHGTGMGEGDGRKDVSHEIEDEEQLLGCSQQGIEEQHAQTEETDTSKGIEMNEDFDGELMDLSQSESDDDNDDSDDTDKQLESKMGDSAENEDILDEKLWNNDGGDELENDAHEKYETGASVQNAENDLELRAKESNDDASENHEEGNREQNQGKGSPESSLDKEDDGNDIDDLENLSLDKNDAYEPPSGVQPSVEPKDLNNEDNLENDEACDKPTDDLGDDIGDDAEAPIDEMEIDGREKTDLEVNDDDHQEKFEEPLPDKSQEKSDSQLGEDTEEANGQDKDLMNQSSREQNLVETTEVTGSQDANVNGLREPNNPQNMMVESESMFPISDLLQPSMLQEANAHNITGSALNNDGEKLTVEAPADPKTGNSESVTGIEMKRRVGLDANPLRSLGDALKEWKERVLVEDAVDTEPDTGDTGMPEENISVEGNEYQYVTEISRSTAQAIGSATADQAEENIPKELDDEPRGAPYSKDDTPMTDAAQEEGNANRNLEKQIQNISKSKVETHVGTAELEDLHNFPNDDTEMNEEQPENDKSLGPLESYVSMGNEMMEFEKGSYNADVHIIRNDIERDLQEISENNEKARAMWFKYEQLTSRLSQELSEQLRLIMEPTLAARLQGDYRTGKRINLKKVIPYIASKFRKDKIWLRRTKPSKRQYQVVLAIDDSRSMSESHCGHLALEALITICRAMSTLEVGELAVASFGQKGNMKILQDFNTPFSSDVGIKMISQFSFKQDNTIADEPMVDLLQCLTCMLDNVAKSAARPSGHQLQQLVLIVADGRFHEKETLRRCIREAVSRGQMLAFIVLDNMHESIIDVQSVSFNGGTPTFSKYIDSFPFPYYILLRNIEELPRTLVDLLRQWFELIQRTSQ